MNNLTDISNGGTKSVNWIDNSQDLDKLLPY